MSILDTPPKYQPDAIPTIRGWMHPKRKELLVSIKLSPEFCDGYFKVDNEIQQEVIIEEVKQPEQKPKKAKAK